MTSRKPNLKAIAETMSASEVPANQPLLSESSTQRMAWARQIQDAQDEKGLIDFQRESLARINETAHYEAKSVLAVTIEAAEKSMERATDDADAIMRAGIAALDQRTADLDKVIAGLTAAVGASE